MRLLLLLFIIIICFSSCSTYRYVYTASPANNPVFANKGESKLAGYYSSADDGSSNNTYAHGPDVQAAYALTDHWAITGSYMHRNERDVYGFNNNIFNFSQVDYKRNLTELGGGYFMGINRKKTITINMFGGYGKGKFSFSDEGLDKDSLAYRRYHQSNISRWYLQPSINFLPGQYIRITYALKFTFIKYNNIRTDYSADELDYFALSHLGGQSLNFTEPSLSLQVGVPQIPWLKIDAIFGGILFRNQIFTRDIRSSNASIGLTMDVTKIGKAKK